MSQDALDLLLSGVKDHAQQKQITSAYYAFANGDPETFAVQFAVLLRAHAISLKVLPARLEKTLATEIHKIGDLVIAHQRSVEKMASLICEGATKSGGGEGRDAYTKIQQTIENQLGGHAEVLRKETEKITSALIANDRAFKRLATERIVLTIILSYTAGILTILVLEHLLPFLT